MRIKIDWVETKNPDWKVANVIQIDGTKLEDVSVNRKNKKGEVFPDFDSIAPGRELECELWRSDAGKWYMFPPKTKASYGGASRGSKPNMENVMEKKKADVSEAQENKAQGIKVSSTMRMAVDLVIEERKNATFDIEEYQEAIRRWRAWLWSEWDKEDKDFPPFN